jgi:hypothetical protein
VKKQRKKKKKAKSRRAGISKAKLLSRTRRIRSIEEEAHFNWLQTSLRAGGEKKDSIRRNDGTSTGISLLWIMSG